MPPKKSAKKPVKGNPTTQLTNAAPTPKKEEPKPKEPVAAVPAVSVESPKVEAPKVVSKEPEKISEVHKPNPEAANSTELSKSGSIDISQLSQAERQKLRAARFGQNIASSDTALEMILAEKQKREERAARFGIETTDAKE